MQYVLLCKSGDSSVFTDYAKTKKLTKFDGTTYIVDVKMVDVIGIQHLLLLADDGCVYKLKKSKREDTIITGFI